MSLSDCPKCWDTPCSCGWEYRYRSNDKLVEFIINILSYKSEEDRKIIFTKLLSNCKCCEKCQTQ